MNSETKPFWVFHEKGGFHQVLAKNPNDAIEQYYDGLKSILGHQLKICECFGDKPLDRSKVLRPIRIKDSHGNIWHIDQLTNSVIEAEIEKEMKG